jgi:hypothetical protein
MWQFYWTILIQNYIHHCFLPFKNPSQLDMPIWKTLVLGCVYVYIYIYIYIYMDGYVYKTFVILFKYIAMYNTLQQKVSLYIKWF